MLWSLVIFPMDQQCIKWGCINTYMEEPWVLVNLLSN